MVNKILWLEIERSISDGKICGVVSYRGEIFIFDHVADRGDDTITCYYVSEPLTPNYGDRLDSHELARVANVVDTVTRFGDNDQICSGDEGKKRPEHQSLKQ